MHKDSVQATAYISTAAITFLRPKSKRYQGMVANLGMLLNPY